MIKVVQQGYLLDTSKTLKSFLSKNVLKKVWEAQSKTANI